MQQNQQALVQSMQQDQMSIAQQMADLVDQAKAGRDAGGIWSCSSVGLLWDRLNDDGLTGLCGARALILILGGQDESASLENIWLLGGSIIRFSSVCCF